MAYAMTKQGSLDNYVTYEFICDAVEDMNAIEDRYRTIGTVAIVLSGASGLEVYIAGSDKQWNSLSSIGGSAASDAVGLSIYICAQDEVSEGVPDVELPDEQTIYLVPAADPDSGNLYDEYIYVEDKWEKFGSGGSAIDLSAYATKADPVFSGSISLGRTSDSTIGENSVAEGHNVVAAGDYSHAEGNGELNESKTIDGTTYTTGGAYGDCSHAEGYGTLALEYAAHAEGYKTIASGGDSHAEGYNTVASGEDSHAEGVNTTASGASSHAEGYGLLNHTNTIDNQTYIGTGAHGYSAHSEGHITWAIGDYSHAEGNDTTASGESSHTEGNGTVASGGGAHAEGGGTIASGSSAHAEGSDSRALGANSHAEGDNTIASGQNSHVSGKNNIEDSNNYFAEIVGNGESISARSNARALDWSGNERLKGDLYVGCNADSTGGTKLPRIPEAPSTDGTYILQTTVTNGTPTYSWISAG